ncbi:MAG: ABC transporter ATP-binding protein [Candidatus Thorarchaeota archaeon]|nr:ABC transporter ATP-binding protein [Candidatus Thorarchaeota archaeon]
MNTNTVLEVHDLKKTYQLGSVPVHALRGVSFEVNAGEFVSVLGPSGSGKSTLLNMIGALDRPSEGTLSIRGTEVGSLNDNQLAELRQRVGFVFQFFNLISRLDAIGNVELPLTIAGVPAEERRARAEQMLEKVGLGDRMHHKPSELSGGERQRVAVARALVSDPSFLLMDEPTGNLDSVTAAEMMDLVDTVNQDLGMTVIVVTHDPDVSDRARRKIRLVDGQIDSDEVNGQ